MAVDKPEQTAETNESGSHDGVPHPAFAAYADESLPGASVGAAGKTGRLELSFADNGGRTRLVRDLARVPFHVSGTLGHDPHPTAETVYVQSPAGGVAQGDRHTVSVAVGPGAVAHVSTSSSTKVLSMERNYAASDLSLSIADGGHLDYVPAPTILHPDARYARKTTVDIDPGASAVIGEVVVPGRLARGERFDFERYVSTCHVQSDGGLLVADGTHLAPGDDTPLADPGVLGEFAVLGTMYVLAPAADVTSLSNRLHEAVNRGANTGGTDSATVKADDGSPIEAGATTLPHDAGVLIRALGHHADPVSDRLHAAWDVARRDLVDAPAPAERRQ